MITDDSYNCYRIIIMVNRCIGVTSVTLCETAEKASAGGTNRTRTISCSTFPHVAWAVPRFIVLHSRGSPLATDGPPRSWDISSKLRYHGTLGGCAPLPVTVLFHSRSGPSIGFSSEDDRSCHGPSIVYPTIFSYGLRSAWVSRLSHLSMSSNVCDTRDAWDWARTSPVLYPPT